VPLQWSYEARGGVGVVRLDRYLGARSVTVRRALGWAAAGDTAAVVLDVAACWAGALTGRPRSRTGRRGWPRTAARCPSVRVARPAALAVHGQSVPVHADLASRWLR